MQSKRGFPPGSSSCLAIAAAPSICMPPFPLLGVQFAAGLPPRTLRDALLRTCGHSPELFLARRACFTASLVACCAFGYVAGVGDRHMANFLLHVRRGSHVMGPPWRPVMIYVMYLSLAGFRSAAHRHDALPR